MNHVASVLAVSLLVVSLAVGVWDVFALFYGDGLPTVSEVVYGWGQKFPPFVAAVFFLLGHLFWPVRPL